MKFKAAITVFLASVILIPGHVSRAGAEIQLPKPTKINADEKTLREFSAFYDQIEEALKEEDLGKMMSFYADDYLHHGITKKQLKFMWLEIFSNFSDLYSVHAFTKIDVHGDDAILVCTGALFGIVKKGGDYTTVDRWVTQNHWLTKVKGEWKMMGGATHEAAAVPGAKLELHPLF